jgi:hypothetical protein
MEPQTCQPDKIFVPLEDDDNQLREDVYSSKSSDNLKYATGCLALSVEPADNEWLSHLNCILLNMIRLSKINPTPFKDLEYQIVRPTIGTAFKC